MNPTVGYKVPFSQIVRLFPAARTTFNEIARKFSKRRNYKPIEHPIDPVFANCKSTDLAPHLAAAVSAIFSTSRARYCVILLVTVQPLAASAAGRDGPMIAAGRERRSIVACGANRRRAVPLASSKTRPVRTRRTWQCTKREHDSAESRFLSQRLDLAPPCRRFQSFVEPIKFFTCTEVAYTSSSVQPSNATLRAAWCLRQNCPNGWMRWNRAVYANFSKTVIPVEQLQLLSLKTRELRLWFSLGHSRAHFIWLFCSRFAFVLNWTALECAVPLCYGRAREMRYFRASVCARILTWPGQAVLEW